jgi:single-strand DNA-binding protein
MANLNKVMLIGRLTADPETRTFSNGGKVANIRFAVNNRRKNQQTGQWEDEPVFVDIKAFNRETGRKLADLVEQYLRKGNQVYIEGHLTLDQWTSQDGQKQSKLRIIMDDFQFLEPRKDGGMSEGGSPAPRMAPAARKSDGPPADVGGYDEAEPEHMEPPPGPTESEIPF